MNAVQIAAMAISGASVVVSISAVVLVVRSELRRRRLDKHMSDLMRLRMRQDWTRRVFVNTPPSHAMGERAFVGWDFGAPGGDSSAVVSGRAGEDMVIVEGVEVFPAGTGQLVVEAFEAPPEVCGTCEDGGWEMYGLGRGDPHFRVCEECGNPEGHECP